MCPAPGARGAAGNGKDRIPTRCSLLSGGDRATKQGPTQLKTQAQCKAGVVKEELSVLMGECDGSDECVLASEEKGGRTFWAEGTAGGKARGAGPGVG